MILKKVIELKSSKISIEELAKYTLCNQKTQKKKGITRRDHHKKGGMNQATTGTIDQSAKSICPNSTCTTTSLLALWNSLGYALEVSAIKIKIMRLNQLVNKFHELSRINQILGYKKIKKLKKGTLARELRSEWTIKFFVLPLHNKQDKASKKSMTIMWKYII